MSSNINQLYSNKNFCLSVLFYIKGTIKKSNLFVYHLESKIEKNIEIYSSMSAVDGDIIENIILIAGGKFDNKYLGTCQKILIFENELNSTFYLQILNCSKLNYPRTYLAMVGINHYFYSIGGCIDDNNTLEKYFEHYDINKDKWTIKPELNFPNSSMTVVNIEDRFIFTFGGYEKEKIQKYDTFLDEKWEIIEISMPKTTRYFGKGLELLDGNTLILGGGNTDGSDFLIFNHNSKYYKNFTKSFQNKMAFSANRPILKDSSIYAISCIQKRIKIDLNKSFPLITEQNNNF